MHDFKVCVLECSGPELWELDLKGLPSFVGMNWLPVSRYLGRCNSTGTKYPV